MQNAKFLKFFLRFDLKTKFEFRKYMNMFTTENIALFNERQLRIENLKNTILAGLTEVEKSLENRHLGQRLQELKDENKRLSDQLEFWKKKVQCLEIQKGIPQIPLPCSVASVTPPDPPFATVESKAVSEKSVTQTSPEQKKPKEKTKAKKPEPPVTEEVDVRRLDFRVGRIISVEKHPDADTLYVEKIDVGEKQPRTVVSGLVNFVPLQEMQNRMIVALCNLKPVKMRGVLSEAMVMCASTPEKVEILNPPPTAVPGDLVTCSDYIGKPDDLLNPKKKIFEQVAPFLKTNDDAIATYKSSPLAVDGKGVVRAESLKNVQIK